MRTATSTKGKASVWRIKGRDDLFAVESQSKTLVNYLVQRTSIGGYICRGNSLRERCWPFYNKGMCKHCTAVADFEAQEEAAEPKPQRTHKLTLIELFPE